MKTSALPVPAAAFRGIFVILLSALLAFLPARRAAAQSVHTNPLNRDPQVREAFQLFYNMDYPGALARFQRIQAAHPADPIATDYVLYVTLFQELNRQDLLDTTFYANDGFLTGKHTVVEDPHVRDQIKALSDKAIDQANAVLDKNSNDANAYFARGWARSLEGTYLAMVERSFGSALKLALGAKNDCRKALDLDPNYVDAKLVVGVYQYVVGALPFGFKILVGIVGIHGSKSSGMALLRVSAAHGVITSVESRTVMALFLRRDAKYQQALAIDEGLQAEYPHNFLFCLERANVSKDAGQGMKPVDLYRQVIRNAQRPGYFASAHVELAWFGLGASLRGQKLYQQSAEAFLKAATQPTTSPELKRRSLLAAGEDYDLMHQHAKATQEYQAVINAGSNTVQGDLARKYKKDSFTGK
ncbi:MAG: tetratricopeptide repeat protein [Acidobacteriaceae bacterium]